MDAPRTPCEEGTLRCIPFTSASSLHRVGARISVHETGSTFAGPDAHQHLRIDARFLNNPDGRQLSEGDV